MHNAKEQNDNFVEIQNEKFRLLFETTSLGITYQNNKGIITDANPAALNILGLTLEQLQGKTPFDSNWKSIREDGSDYPGEQHPSMLALKTGKPVLNKTMGIINSIENEYRWIRIDATPQSKNNEKPYLVYTTFTDITDIKKKEKELLKQSNFATTMTQKHPAGIVACNSEGKLVLFNDTAKEWHTIDILKTPKEKWAENYGLYSAETDTLLEISEIPLIRAFNGEKVVNVEMLIKAKNQKSRYVSCNGSSFFDELGNKLGALAIMNDITHQKLNELEIKKSEQEVKRRLAKVKQSEFFLKESAKIGGWSINLISQKLTWSDQVFRIHGLPIGKLPSLEEALDFFVDGSKEILTNAIEESIAKNKKYDLELRFKNAQNKKLWVNTIGYPVSNKKGEIIGLRGVFQDITEQKLIRSQVEENQEMYNLLANNTIDIICLQKPNGKFKYITPSVKKILGYEISEVIEKDIFYFIHESDFVNLNKFIKNKVLSATTRAAHPFKIRHKDGHFMWLEILSTPVYKGDKINYIVTSARDISEWVSAKEKIEKHQKSLQNLTNEITIIEEKQKKQIASNIHDNLSQALVISKMKVNDLIKNPSTKTINEDLKFIESHISQALENSRKITYELSPPVLYQLGIIEALNWLIESLDNTYKINFQFNTDLFNISLNETKSIILYRSVQELLSNAIKHSKASLVVVKVEKTVKNVIINIVDNGVGFDILKLNDINNHNGSGFGLITVKERINNLKGKFEITSLKNIETSFKISIPLS